MSALLSLRGLRKSYGALKVTDDVSLDVGAGEIHAVIGPNGAGKTTLMNLITGEVRADAGEVLLGDRDLTRLSVPARVHAGLCRSYQITSAIRELSVLENVVLAVQATQGSSLLHGWLPALSQPGLVDAADAVLDRVGLLAQRRRRAGTLSHGQQRQLELAITLAARPRVLLLDEPMAGLGPTESQAMVATIESLRGQAAVLLVEHDMSAVFKLADRLSVLVYGKLVCSGTVEEIKASPIVREAYLGDEVLPA